MKNKILIATALFFNAYFLLSCDNTNNKTTKNEMDSSMPHKMQNDSMNSGKMQMDNGMMQSLSSTMGKMNEMKMTGDFDLDFVNMMIIHHQAAIDMSEVEVTKGTDTQMKTMAQNIVTAQKVEIEQLHQFVKNYKIPEAKKMNGEMHNELGETMKSMMDKMNNMQMTGNTDKDFAMMMKSHHESAVKMAEDELSHGKQYEVKKMAQKMITDQSKEIADFKVWLDGQK